MICAGLPVAGGRPPASVPAPASARSAAISLSRAVSRSASRRELANTIVDRCWLDQVGDPLLDVRPDRRGALRASRPSSSSMVARARSCPRPGRRPGGPTPWSDGGRRSRPDAVPPRKRATSSSGRTVADSPIRWAGLREQRVEPLERHRQVGAPLGAGHRVHLVDDHGLDAPQGLAGLGGQHQEQRLGGGDQDVGRRGSRAGAGRPPACRPTGRRPGPPGPACRAGRRCAGCR